MNHRDLSRFGLVAAVATASPFVACLSSSSAPGGGSDGGLVVPDDAALPGLDGASNQGDGGPSISGPDGSAAADGAAGGDAAAAGDGGSLGAITCGAPTTLDSAGNQVAGMTAATLASGRYLVAWLEVIAGGNAAARKVRLFDGSGWQPKQTLDSTNDDHVPIVAGDGVGGGYAAWEGATTLGRAALAPGSTQFGAATSLAGTNTPAGLAGLSTGGAILVHQTGSALTVSDYDVTGGAWGPEQSIATGIFSYQVVATNRTGKAALSYYSSSELLYVSTYDGTTWSAPSTGQSIVPTTGTGRQTGSIVNGVYANGDVLLVYYDSTVETGNTVKTIRYHVTGGTFDAAQTVDVGGANLPNVFVDAADRATVIYLKAGHAMAARDLGAGWGAPVDLGTTQSTFAPAMDADGNIAVLVLSTSATPAPAIRRIAAAGTAWTDPVLTGLPNGGQAAIAFDVSGKPVVFGAQLDDGGTRAGLVAVVCQ